MARLTREQRIALWRVFTQTDDMVTYRAFRRTVQTSMGCVMVRVRGMWLGIEPDGYTHS